MQKFLKYFTDIRLWYGLIGVIIAIAAHEAFHVIAHIGHIENLTLFPNAFTAVELTLDDSPTVLTHDAEEMIAYTITILILLLTVIDMFAITDSRDKRSTTEIIFAAKRKK